MSYLREEALDETNYPLFAEFQTVFGFIPNFYRAQTMKPGLIEAEAGLFNAVVLDQNALTRAQKEYIFLVCSAANLSTYCVTLHCEMVRMLGVAGPEPELIAMDHMASDLPMDMKALLSFATRLNTTPNRIGPPDMDTLRTYGFTDEQILETVVTVGLAKFANTLSVGLGTIPDLESKIVFPKGETAKAGAPVRF